jgi:condensin-2 complex subunit D3
METALQDLLTSENTSQIESSLKVIIHCLNHDKKESRNVTVRNSLPESTDLSRLIRVLESLITARVPTETLLPGTYDDEANEQALAHNPALTLTTISLLSARIYAQLLALPGALGAGLVEAQATSALAALLRRWREECIGREKTAWKHERDEDSDECMVEEVTEDSFASPVPEHQLVTCGLEVLVPLSRCLLNREFLTWSSEARDSIVDAVVAGMATSAAIHSVKITDREETLCRNVITAATESIHQCLVLKTTNDSDEEDDEDDLLMESGINKATKRRETMLAILRTIYPSIVFKDVVPNGEQGKQAACQASSYAFELFVKHSCSSAAKTGRLSLGGTPTGLTTVTTPKRSMTPSNRSSIGSSARITPAKLKSTVKASRNSYDSVRKIDSMHAAIVGTLQKITTDRELEKTNIRRCALETVLRTLAHLQPAERERFLSFVIQLCHSKVSLHRLVGCQLTGDILVESWLWKEHAERSNVASPSPAASVDRRKSLSPLLCRSRDNMTEALFGVLVGRLQDRIPTIRMTSASCFAKIFDSLQESACDETLKTSFADFLSLEGHSLAQTLRKRANDDKATVRRSAVEALSGLLMICQADDNNMLEPSGADVDVFSTLCNDESVMVRKVSAEALTNLLHGAVSMKNVNFLYDVETAWSSSVLVMVLDSEPSCVAKALELVEIIVLAPIMEETELRAESAWRILASIQEGSSSSGRARSQSQALKTFVANAVASSDASATVKRQILNEVVSKCASTLESPSTDLSPAVIENQRTGAWCLLEALVSSFSKPKEFAQLSKRYGFDLDFLGSSWERLCQLSDSASEESVFNLHKAAKYALKVLSKVVALLGKDSAQDAAEKLYHRIHSFSLTTEVIGDAITALVATTTACTDNSVDTNGRCKTMIEKLYSACESLISSQLASTSNLDYNFAKLGRAIFSVGDLSLVGFHPSDDKKGGLVENRGQKQSSTEEDPVRGLHFSPGPTLARLIQAFLPHRVAGTSGVPTPESLRAHAYLAVGKICLRDETLCKQSLNILARELHENMQQGSWRVQSNALLVLSDLCVQYTSMVDRYLPVMAACMQAGLRDLSGSVLNVAVQPDSAIVRKHAVTVLASLLLQDYIKWRGLLFYRFLVATVDEDEEVANLAEMLLCGPLITKQPRLFSNNFVEAIFVLNRCTAHPIYLAATANDDQGSDASIGFEGIYLSGEVGRARRMQIYQLLLSRVSDEEKLGLTARITKEVLGSALKGGNDLHEVCTNPFVDDDEVLKKGVDSRESAMAVLSDALAILSDPSMKVGRSANKDTEEEDIEDPNVTSNANKTIQVAKGALFSKISKKHLLEILLPILCQLKVVLQKSQSPLLKNLMSFLVDVYRQNKDETKEFLANDPSLYQEIEYDARQFIKKRAWRTPAKKSKNAATLRTPLSVKQ